MFYSFVCRKGHREDVRLSMAARHRTQRCRRCQGEMTRVYTAPGVTGHPASQTLYEFEREKWNLATGQNFQNAQELADWAKASGKEIVGPTYRTPKQVPAEDREIDKALNEVWEKNHRISFGG